MTPVIALLAYALIILFPKEQPGQLVAEPPRESEIVAGIYRTTNHLERRIYFEEWTKSGTVIQKTILGKEYPYATVLITDDGRDTLIKNNTSGIALRVTLPAPSSQTPPGGQMIGRMNVSSMRTHNLISSGQCLVWSTPHTELVITTQQCVYTFEGSIVVLRFKSVVDGDPILPKGEGVEVYINGNLTEFTESVRQ